MKIFIASDHAAFNEKNLIRDYLKNKFEVVDLGTNDAKMARLHNDANVLCLGGRKTSPELLKKICDKFLATSFEGGRHQIRIDQFDSLGQ